MHDNQDFHELEHAGLIAVTDEVAMTAKGRVWYERLAAVDQGMDASESLDELASSVSALVR